MASIIERLRDTLDEEVSLYETLLEVSRKKTQVIIAEKLEELTAITDEEQALVDKITNVDNTRSKIMEEVAAVLGTDASQLKLDALVRALEKRPEEQKPLAETAEKLGRVVRQVRGVNYQNKELIDSALEMIEFEMNLLHSSRSAPQTANYGKGAYSTGDVLGTGISGFDAKQ